ncbi:MAG: U32 family peptidase [Coriobacteriia bacterium]|nr:U32 family peptidase [Coriobacteriia bacterium]
MQRSNPSVPELLAPAGGPAALRAAIANGADAVYLGVELLNARRGAENFSLDNLAETCRFAHIRGVRVYLTANVVVLQGEMATALDLLDRAWEAGVDAVIVQDLGLLWAVRKTLPHVRVHSSTQMNAHNTATLETLAALGVKRVTLAREVSVREIAGFVSAVDVEVESFVHGALCMCYSGQCLISSLIGRRSANRGLCAQPCRLPYELVDASGTILATPGAHLLSPKDLAGIAILPQLVASGVSALKIEGRMKSAEYVALVTGVYRAALDRAIADPGSYVVRDGEQAVLGESFSRGFSEAYLLDERGNEMMSYQRPNNRGVLVGRVASTSLGTATVALDTSLEAGDTVEFWTSAGRFAQHAGHMTFEGAGHDVAPAGAKAQLHVEQPVGAGDRVFRVRNAALSAAAARTFDDADSIAPIELTFRVRVVVGQPLSVSVVDAAGRRGSADGPAVELARTKAVTAEEVTEHVGRLGGTPYRAVSWDLELSPNVGVGFSALHRVRRDALAAYEAQLLAPWATRRATHPRVPPVVGASRGKRTQTLLAVSVTDEAAAIACLAVGADRALVPTTALGAPHDLTADVIPVLPRIAHDREVGSALAWATTGRRVVAGNLGVLAKAAAQGAAVESDWSLNAVNPLSIAQLAELGAQRVWLSPELSGRQVADVAAASMLPTGITVYGRQELMVTEHCILMSEGECDRRCGTCERRASRRVLRDRKGYEFPIVTDVTGRSHLYNSVPLDLASELAEIVAAGVSAVRLDLELETVESAADATRRFREALERLSAGIETPARDKSAATTSGHYFRGIL